MKRFFVLVAVISFTAIWVGCSKDESSNAEVLDVQPYYEIGVNSTVEFQILENSDGGYRWQWINRSKCAEVDSIGFRTQSTNSDPNICGAPVNAIWTFKGLKAGIDTLKFEEKRSFEPNSTIETKEVVIKVK
jgi:Chagasin family peptidase inhibitor I42.